MTDIELQKVGLSKPIRSLLVVGVILVVAVAGQHASLLWLVMAIGGGLILLAKPQLSLLLLIVATLMVDYQISTGTEVRINVTMLLIPLLLVLWLLDGIRRHDLHWVVSRVNRPLGLFLLAGLLSFLLGNALWDPAVAKSSNFWLVQLAQWAIFVFSACAFWLTASLARNERWLQVQTWTLLIFGGVLVILALVPAAGIFLPWRLSLVLSRAPLPVLLFAVSAGQLIHNRNLTKAARVALLLLCVATTYYVFAVQQESLSTWGALVTVMGVLFFKRLPRKFRLAFVLAGMLGVIVLYPVLYDFAGGDDEWSSSGVSRWGLISRVLEVTKRNPITGLGPASYRAYAATEPLQHKLAIWWIPQVNSHNNYVDLYAHTGIVGLGLFLWFMVEFGILGWRLGDSYTKGDFLAGYIHGVYAAYIAMWVLMMLADWLLPFVYNIGFYGFRASVLVWLFMGGMISAKELTKQSEVAVA